MIVIFLASATPVPPAAAGAIPDKLVHACIYGVLALLFLYALAGQLRGPFRWPGLLGAVVLAAAYGVTDEVHQAFVPTRTADPIDLIADVAGAALAVAAAQWRSAGQGHSGSAPPGDADP